MSPDLPPKRRPWSRHDLAFAASAEWRRSPRPFSVIADARRESWHAQTVTTDGTLSTPQRLATAELPSGELLMPAGFRVWSKAPAGLGTCNYDLAALTGLSAETDLFRSVETPDALQHAAPDYKKWSAQPHSAATARA